MECKSETDIDETVYYETHEVRWDPEITSISSEGLYERKKCPRSQKQQVKD